MDWLKKLENVKKFYQEPGFVLPEAKPEKPIADQYQDYKQVQDIFEPRTQMYIEREMGFDDGGQVIGKPGPGRQGYQGKKSNLPTFVHNNYTGTGEINKTNPYSVYKKGEKRISFSTIEDAEKYIKEKGWVKTDPTKVRSKKVEQNIINYFDNMFNDPSKSADELLNPIKKIHEGTGHDFKAIKKALDKYPPAQDMKEIITRLSRPAFVKKIAGKDWKLDDVIAAVETKSASTRSLNPTDRIMENAARHYAQAEPGKSLIQFYDNKNTVITDLKNIDIYKDDIYFKYRDDSTKPFKAKKYGLSSSLEDVADIARTGRQEPLFKEYFSKVDELTDLKNTPVWDDLTPGLKKVFAKKGSKTTFGDVMRYAYNQGSGYSMKYFPYNIDHKSGVATKPFSDLRIISRRINQAAGHVSKWMPVGAQNYLKSMGYLFDKDMKTLVKDELTLADDILTKGRKLFSPYQIAKNKENLAQTGKKAIRPAGTFNAQKKEIWKAFQAQGIGKNCPVKRAEGGRIGFNEAGLVDDDCMRNAINEHKRKLADGNKVSIEKQMKINQTKSLKNIFTTGRRGLQTVLSGVGLDHPLAAGLEVAIEAAFYGYGRQQGESHEQARENLFLPKIIEKYVPDYLKDTELWKKYGIKPFKTGVWEGPERLIEEELIGTRWDPSGKVNPVAEYADNLKALENEYDKFSSIQLKLDAANNPRTKARPEIIQGLEQELNESLKKMEKLEINIKPGTPQHDAYMIAQERQKGLRDERAQGPKVKPPSYGRHKQGQWRDEFLDYREADPKYGQSISSERDPDWKGPHDPFAFKGGLYDELGLPLGWWEEEGYTPEQKWKTIYDMGGFDLKDKIGIAGGVAKMADGGIAGIRRPHAIAPESGPAPQGEGLSYILNRVREW